MLLSPARIVLGDRRSTKVILGISGALALSVAVQLYAQQQPSQPITITGCLQQADARRGRRATAATGTSGTEQFVLAKIDSTKSSSEAPADGSWFVVTGNVSDLRADLNRRVEITGTVDTTGSVVGTSASVADGPSGTIHATAVKVVGANCGEKIPRK